MTALKRFLVTAFACLATMLSTPAIAQMKTLQPPLVEGAAKVRVEAIKVHSPALEGNLEGNAAIRDVFVVLPPSYDRNPTRQYPVVYALHGYWIGAQQWMGEVHMPQTAEGAFAKGTPEMIIVFPDSKTRHLGSLYASGGTVGDFETYISRDVIAYVDSHYRTIARPESRGLVGHSMGGYGATRIGIKHAELFGALYVMSPGGLTSRGFGQPDAATLADIENLKAVEDLAKLPGSRRGLLAMSAAFSPNPNKPPFYLDLPYENGLARPEISAKWVANAPLAFIDQYAAGLKHYKSIAIDVGDKDGLGGDARALHAALGVLGIENTLEIYEGDHTSHLGFRMQDHVLPFFGRNLVASSARTK